MLEITPTTRFKKDLKRYRHQVKILKVLHSVIELLMSKKALPEKYVDHPLGGGWIGSRDCHITPDTLLIYRVDETSNKLFLERLGSHSELF